MNPVIITSAEILRRYMPNLTIEAIGEPSFFDKMQPYILAAETWLAQELVSPECIASIPEASPEIKEAAEAVAAYQALSMALPSLDVVLTPNGFGVVSNQNVAPASKERMERLVDSLVANRDRSIATLAKLLPSLKGWFDTRQAWFFNSRLYWWPDLAERVNGKLSWDGFVNLRPLLSRVETAVERRWIGAEYMEKLRDMAIGKESPTEADKRILRRLYPIIIDAVMNSGELDALSMNDVVDIIRNSPEDYPLWHESPIADYYDYKGFENKKDNHGYWF